MKSIFILLLCILLTVGMISCARIPVEEETTTTSSDTEPPSPEEETTTVPVEETTTPPAEETTTKVPQNPFDEDGFPNPSEDDATKRY